MLVEKTQKEISRAVGTELSATPGWVCNTRQSLQTFLLYCINQTLI